MMTQEQRTIEANRLKNTFKRNYLIPTIGIFMDVQTAAARAALEDPVKFKLDCAKDLELEKKFYDNFSKQIVGDSRIKKLTSDRIEHPRMNDVKKFVVMGDEFGSYIQFNTEEAVDIFVRKPRGIAYTIEHTIPGTAKYEIQNAYNIYSGEVFSIAIRFDDAWIAIRPEMLEGKTAKSVVLWFWCPQTGVLTDDAANYFNCDAILNLFKG